MSISLSFNSPEPQSTTLLHVITRIWQSQDLHRVFKVTTTEIRQILEADRVAVFHFLPYKDWEGEFVAESVGPAWKSALAYQIHDHCFGDKFAPLYQQGKTHALSDIYEQGLEDCYVQILAQFQVRANLVVPILKGKELWGLLCVHQCEGPREWQTDEIELMSAVGKQLGIAVQQAEYLQAVKDRSDRQKILVRVLAQVRKSQDLTRTFKITAQEVRQFLDADRVGVFQFDPQTNWEGEFIAESVGAPWKSALAIPTYDHCFSQNFVSLYQRGRTQEIADIYNPGLQDCYIKILERFEVRANLIVPILTAQSDLWGLLCIHQCEGPRHWQEDEIEFVVCIAEELGIAIQQATYLQTVKDRADHQRILVQAISRIRKSQDIHRIFKTTVQELRHLLDCDRVIILRFNPEQNWEGEFIAESVGPRWKSALDQRVNDPRFSEQFAPLYQQGQHTTRSDITVEGSEDCYQQILEQFEVKANLVVPITIEEELWGLFCIHQCEEPRHWQAEEVEFVQLLVEHLGVAIQQTKYLEQMQQQSTQMAQAEARKQIAERQNLIARTVDKIRQSLDLETIFPTTTREVRSLLNLDRVAIYQFESDWSGYFVAESVAHSWIPLVDTPIVIADTHLQDTRGGRYRHQETFAVDDIYTAGHTDCHIELLEKFQAKAYAIAPIFQGEKLWGLLAGYQNDGPRHWKAEDLDLMVQIAAQLGLAIQQANLLAETRQQTEELTETLKTLRTTQLQLIQGEKMSSLGQLVAGIAHEINNPVNFIHANLQHVKDYVEELFKLVSAYQNHRALPDSMASLAQKHDLAFLQEDLPKTLASISNGSERIRELVLSLRNFSRLDEAEVKEVDVVAGIESTLIILQHRLNSNGRRPEIQLIQKYEDKPKIECFAAQLNQVFMNLLSNAIDALEDAAVESPTIEIRTQDLGSHIEVTISNNGPRIAEKVYRQMFNPFFTTKPPGRGTGLGLSIAYQIVVEKHGGQLVCESEADLTTFRVTLPCQRPSSDQ
ncbi:MAG: GAF domain-containing protein [Leptolyngbya sp. SIO1D8]|nr:GAF domain-containing protein [Leptolyngbya sp. SIO1D8]